MTNQAKMQQLLADAETRTLEDAEILALSAAQDTAALVQLAGSLRDAGHQNVVSYSRKVFIPLTHLCRDVCHYCTFAQVPRKLKAPYLTPDEVLKIAEDGAQAGCKEALFTLGDKPELRYKAAREGLKELKQESTLSYLRDMAELVLDETGLFPHLNPGLMAADELAELRKVSISMGIMLESASDRLLEKGMPHHGSPDKVPARRLETMRLAGEARVPFTSGILIGIGETRRERIESLLAIRDANKPHGHIQEIIIQNFRAKPETLMVNAPEPDLNEMLWTLALARIIFGADMNIQAPPNLSPGGLEQLVSAGINDWGGVSPVTPDFVNPEAPWPHLANLANETANAGKHLTERLALYPAYARQASKWVDPQIEPLLLQAIDGGGFARSPGGLRSPRNLDSAGGLPSSGLAKETGLVKVTGQAQDASLPSSSGLSASDGLNISGKANSAGSRDDWSAGALVAPPATDLARVKALPRISASPDLAAILQEASAGERLDEQQIVRLFQARGDDFTHVCQAADRLRQEVAGDEVTYCVNRNINYTNICYFKCQFCAFSKGKMSENLRGKPYDLDHDEIMRRSKEAWARGASEVCLQGGIHPEYTGQTYIDICRSIKQVVPDMHIHAFSPLEVWQGAKTLGVPISDFLQSLKEAGLGTLPGTAAEILDDEVRADLCPDKINTGEWLEVMEAAHQVGFNTTATIMYGHIEQYHHLARHLLRIRDLQARTGGFTEFVILPFIHLEAPIYLKGKARKGPTFREAILIHAIARLALHPHFRNIQASWTKLGHDGVRACLEAGVNDLGGTLMNETITRAAGASHGQETSPEEMEAIITSIGRQPRQRSTTYGEVSEVQRQKSYGAVTLLEPTYTSAKKYERKNQQGGSQSQGKRTLVRSGPRLDEVAETLTSQDIV